MINTDNAEIKRLQENAKKKVPLEKWGPYLTERQWGTVREDYSKNGDAWDYFPHDHARSRVYRWGEDGLGGISDINQQLCFALALWNGNDSILKERLFGLSNPQGNHGEDVKELYYYLDNLPTHYYMKYLYKYPQPAFPYEDLVTENKKRGKLQPEYELLDTGIFNEDKYFDVFIEYAKENAADIFIKIEIVNRGNEKAPITVLPTLWFYNNWQYAGDDIKPSITLLSDHSVKAEHKILGNYYFYFQAATDVLFTENETNFQKLFGWPNKSEFVKDAFHEAIIHGTDLQKLKDKKEGTKCSPVYYFEIEPKQSEIIYLRLSDKNLARCFPKNFERIFIKRKKEADDFYENIHPSSCTDDQKNIQRQAFAGLLWNKQFYHYDVERWISTSDGITPDSDEREEGRNHDWKYLKNLDILSMPDNWEYPWYAAWDMAFHCITMAVIDPLFAKHQLTLLMREWYMSPQGQLPAYEWNFSDVNPPVHAFAALQVYKTEERLYGKKDLVFLKSIFQKLIINFTWWINRKDANGNNIFEGGFLGLDNIGLFNRSEILPGNILLEQTDGTSWMGMYALDMMNIALEIALNDISFEDTATKFYEHFVIIAEALNELGLWDEKDKFFYDVLSLNKSDAFPLRIRSMVGLSPLFAVTVIEKEVFEALPDFTKRMKWFRDYRKTNNLYLPSEERKSFEGVLLSLVDQERLKDLFEKLLDESEFLSEGGIRALSKFYETPYTLEFEGHTYSIQYDPGDSTSDMFGGNSNWRGPVWVPMNYLFINAFRTFGYFYEDDLKVECPVGSGNYCNLSDVGKNIAGRLLHIFEKNEKNERLTNGYYNWFYQKEENQDLVLFHEYFHGDNLRGLGASHQTGWTALIANLILDLKEEEQAKEEENRQE
ncbi:MAG: MGH1-like glycoside hydrolase domain-containing protein [Ginsengibacter sp.]